MKFTKRLFSTFTAFILITAGGCNFGSSGESENSKPDDIQVNASVSDTTTVTTTTTPVPVENPVVRVIAAGDNLIHSSIYNQAHQRALNNGNDGYDFDYAYQYVEDLICGDLNVLNQETIIANDEFEPSDYPCFNSPTQLGQKMMDMGFNAFSMSNNHVLDKGEAGLIATLDYWAKYPQMTVYGAYRNEADMNNIRIREVNGITFAFLGYMEHTNGLSLPEGSECKLVYLKELDTIQQQIQTADKMADVVVVSPHWGVEIQNEVTDEQKALARKFVDWGADIIIGTQPHTVQTMEYLPKADGSQAFVFYSLGNFISAQSRNLAMVGMLADFNVTKDMVTNEILISDVKAIPLITHYDWGYANVRVYPYNLYTPELASSHGILADTNWFGMDFIDTIISENIPQEFLKED